MKKCTIAVLASALSLAAAGCAGIDDGYERAVEDAEWYDAYHADKRRCQRIGGAFIVENLWATRLTREVRPGARYSCSMRR